MSNEEDLSPFQQWEAEALQKQADEESLQQEALQDKIDVSVENEASYLQEATNIAQTLDETEVQHKEMTSEELVAADNLEIPTPDPVQDEIMAELNEMGFEDAVKSVGEDLHASGVEAQEMDDPSAPITPPEAESSPFEQWQDSASKESEPAEQDIQQEQDEQER